MTLNQYSIGYERATRNNHRKC
uniref:Uncharacterized protein n=1 Tax=Anguilla anguilla TaxID=7936 RepID=A0A0E9TAE7_ANGAN